VKKSFKILILIVTLGLPVGIYLFLQAFGENKYELPVFPETAIENSNCGHVARPYIIRSLTCEGAEVVELGEHHYLFHFPDFGMGIQPKEINEIRRVLEETTELSLRLITFTDSTQMKAWEDVSRQVNEKYWIVTSACEGGIEQMKDCQLLFALVDLPGGETKSKVALVDSKGRVRGHYSASDRKETDRLILELNVLAQEK